MKKLLLILIIFGCIQINAKCISRKSVDACRGLNEDDKCSYGKNNKIGTCQFTVPNKDIICGTGGPVIGLYCKVPKIITE